MEKSHRLFLRNLSADVNNDDLEKLFSEYGTITNIDIKEKIQNDGTKIGFVTMTTNDKMLNTCFRSVNGAKLKNNSIHLEVAKESYMDRLKREREEAANKKTVIEKILPSKESIEPLNIKIPKIIQNRSTKIIYNLNDTNKEPEEYQEQAVEKILQFPLKIDSPFETRPKVLPQVFETPYPKFEKTVEKKPTSESEIKRLASLKQKIQTFKTHGKLISQALKSVDVKNKHMKFDFSDGNEDSGILQKKRKKTLFDNEENSDDQESWDEIKFEHDEKRNAKLKMSMTNLNGDKRFTIDERFIDDKEPDEKAETEEQEDDLRMEAKWQLDILSNVLGKPVRAKDGKSQSEKKQNKMIRYDPTSKDHQEHELTVQKPEKTKKNKAKKDVVEEEEAPIPISKEIFYEVKENLTESLQPTEEFSLLKSFGKVSPKENTTMEDNETANAIEKKNWDSNYVVTKPFKYDSSDDEAPNPLMQEVTVKDDLSSGNKQRSSNGLFFFTIDDERFNEAKEFFRTRPATSLNFTNIRRELKQIVRAKIRNNIKKSATWRKKKVSRQAKNHS